LSIHNKHDDYDDDDDFLFIGLGIGVIYGGYEGYQYPHFLDWGYSTPTFQDENVKNLLLLLST